MRVLLVNDTEAHYHWGCTGTCLAVKEDIQNLGFALSSITIRETKAWKDVPQTKDGFVDEAVFSKFCKANPELIDKVNTTDVLVINGEGTIHGGLRANPLRLLYIAFIAKTRFKKNVQVINHQVYIKDYTKDFYADPNHPPQTEDQYNEAYKIYSMVYATLDFIAIREHLSFQQAKDWNPTATMLAFDSLPLYIRDHYQPTKSKGINENKVLVVGGSVAWELKGIPPFVEYLKKMAKDGYIIKILIGAKGDPAQDDKAFSECLDTYLRETPWELIDANSIQVWLNTIHQADLVVSGRFHYTIAAACLETRTIVLNSNTLKNHAISEILNLPKPLDYADQDLFNLLIIRTEETFKMPPPQRYMERLCVLAKNNFTALRQLRLEHITQTLIPLIGSTSHTTDNSSRPITLVHQYVSSDTISESVSMSPSAAIRPTPGKIS